MAFTPPPSVLPPFARTLFARDLNLGRTIEHIYDYVYVFEPAETVEWRRFQVICEDTSSATTADDAVITFDFVNYTGGNIDPSWDAGDYAAIGGQIHAFLTIYAPFMQTTHMFTDLKAYVMAFNPDWAGSSPDLDIQPFMESGGPDYVGQLNISGTSAQHMPAQVSCSITEEVPVRRAWGRFYLPFCGYNLVEPLTGRFNTGSILTIVTAAHDMYDNLATGELKPIVVHTLQDRGRVAAFSQVIAVRGDDVPDIIRRRRPKFSLYTSRQPAAAAAAEVQPAASPSDE